MAAVRKRVLSGVQPTGVLHLGNYLGAIRQWVANQELYDNYFCVVDLHATTSPHVPKELTKDTYRTAALYLATAGQGWQQGGGAVMKGKRVLEGGSGRGGYRRYGMRLKVRSQAARRHVRAL